MRYVQVLTVVVVAILASCERESTQVPAFEAPAGAMAAIRADQGNGGLGGGGIVIHTKQ